MQNMDSKEEKIFQAYENYKKNKPSKRGRRPKSEPSRKNRREFEGFVEKRRKNEGLLTKGKDHRKQFTKPNTWPYSATGYLETTFEGEESGSGTGFMIANSVVLTAAHNVFYNGKEAKSIIFVPGLKGKDARFGVHEVEKWYFPEEFKTGDDEEDYAILILKPNPKFALLGRYTGIYGLKVFKKKDLEEKILVFGYPGDKIDEDGKHLYGMESRSKRQFKVEDKILKYKLDTSGGQSGCGVLIRRKRTIVGVHVGENRIEKVNEAVTITDEKMKQISKWIESHFLKCIYNIKKLYLPGERYELWEKLLKRVSFQNLQHLALYGYQHKRKHLKRLSFAELPNLKHLTLSGWQLTGGSLKELSKFSNLKILSLSDNQIDNEGIIDLSAQNLPHLASLILSWNNISDNGVIELSKANFPNLSLLDLSHNRIKNQLLENILKKKCPRIAAIFEGNPMSERKHVKPNLSTPRSNGSIKKESSREENKANSPRQRFLNSVLQASDEITFLSFYTSLAKNHNPRKRAALEYPPTKKDFSNH